MTKLIQDGNRQAKIVLVGEAPGETEERTGLPFQGGAGELLNRMLSRVGIRRSDCFVTNVCHVRPPKNEFKWFFTKANQHHLVRGMLQLKADLEAIRPNVVVALGAQPLKVLTGKQSIDKWRGSILSSSLVPGLKVIGTYHPAYILRVYDYKTVAEFDLLRVKGDAEYPDLRLPVRTHYLPTRVVRQEADGSLTKRQPNPGEIALIEEEMYAAEWLSIDIECWQDATTGQWKLACVGFSDRAERSLVIHVDGPAARHRIARLCQSSGRKVFQNGTFDVTVLKDEGIEVTNFGAAADGDLRGWDTMLAHHTLFAESASGSDEIATMSGKKRQSAIAKGLAFQASIYTREPFYKDDGKLWRETGDLETFWLYNGRDVAVTREIRDVQDKELRDAGQFTQVFHPHSLIDPLMAATRRGIKIDLSERARLTKEIEKEISNLQTVLDGMAGGSLNVSSNPQVTRFLYETIKLPAQYKRGSANPTADKDAVNKLGEKYQHPGLHAILKIRERRTIVERYLSAPVDKDGRMRCSFDITGTRSRRLSSRASIYGSGTNLQNIPARRKVGEQIKRMFIADEGKCFVYRDYSQAEVWCVAAYAEEDDLFDLLLDPNRDVHRENAARIFNKPVDKVTDEERYLAKRAIHSSNYGVGGNNLATKVNEDYEVTGIRITPQQGDRVIQSYFMLYPKIKEVYWREVEQELRYTRTLSNAFGWKRTFYARWDDKLLREAYSFPPQSTVGQLGASAFVACHWDLAVGHPEWGAEVLLNVHDSILIQCNIESVEAVADAMARSMAIPVSIKGRTFTIPTDCKIGLNWAKAGEHNPNGLRDIEKGGREWLREISRIG